MVDHQSMVDSTSFPKWHVQECQAAVLKPEVGISKMKTAMTIGVWVIKSPKRQFYCSFLASRWARAVLLMAFPVYIESLPDARYLNRIFILR